MADFFTFALKCNLDELKCAMHESETFFAQSYNSIGKLNCI